MTTVGLYCRDNENRERMKQLLSRTDHEGVLLQSREELLLLVPRRGIHLLVIDYLTPDERNAFVVTQELREKHGTRNISIILKIETEDQLEDEISSQGVNDFLLCPFHEEEFLALIDKYSKIEKRRPFQSLLRISDKNGQIMGKTLNISTTGLLVQVSREMPIGSSVSVHFFLPQSREEIRCGAVIRRRAHERLTFNPCYGLEFVDLPSKAKAKLQRFVKRW